MNLQEHLSLIGFDAGRLARKAEVPEAVIHHALAGKPIAKAHAERIAHALSSVHQMPKHQGLKAEDIDDFDIVDPNELKTLNRIVE